jgi:S1-C subfamily serine protease
MKSINKLISAIILIVTVQNYSFSKELYVYITPSPVIQKVGVKLFIDDIELIKLQEGQYWYGDIGNINSCELKAKSGTYFTSRVINLNFQYKDAAFVIIQLDQMSWQMYEQTYPNVPIELKSIYEQRKNQKEINNRISVHPNTGYTKTSLKEYLNKNKSYNEGIYENAIPAPNSPKYEIGIIKTEDGYTLIYLSGGDNSIWKEGDVKAYLTKTANPNLYKVKYYLGNKDISDNLYITFENETMKVVWTDGSPEQLYIKLYPLSSNSSSDITSSGTGFALSNDGYIITNYHVIEGATTITVKGLNGVFSNSYKAKIVVSDKTNDLAIIQVEDNSFSNISKIPYTFKNHPSDVGENVFVLGYPLRATMGDEIKLTNGIISSKTGFQGDITSYQISAPVQPGNSGGPLFDKSGNIIGVINSKHTGAENVSYAIKVNYLKNLIDMLPKTITFNNTNTLTNLSLSDQVKLLNKYVYIIEIK